MGLPRKPLLVHKRPGKGECRLGNYFKFISAIKCNYVHRADAFVLVKLSLAQEVVEDVVLVTHTSAALSAGAAAGKDPHARQGTSSLSSLFISSLWRQLFIGETCFFGVGGQA